MSIYSCCVFILNQLQRNLKIFLVNLKADILKQILYLNMQQLAKQATRKHRFFVWR